MLAAAGGALLIMRPEEIAPVLLYGEMRDWATGI
jgi:hypothetical protein